MLASRVSRAEIMKSLWRCSSIIVHLWNHLTYWVSTGYCDPDIRRFSNITSAPLGATRVFMHNFIVAGLTEWNGSHIMPYKYATWLRAIDTHDLAVDRSILIQVSDDRDPLACWILKCSPNSWKRDPFTRDRVLRANAQQGNGWNYKIKSLRVIRVLPHGDTCMRNTTKSEV